MDIGPADTIPAELQSSTKPPQPVHRRKVKATDKAVQTAKKMFPPLPKDAGVGSVYGPAMCLGLAVWEADLRGDNSLAMALEAMFVKVYEKAVTTPATSESDQKARLRLRDDCIRYYSGPGYKDEAQAVVRVQMRVVLDHRHSRRDRDRELDVLTMWIDRASSSQ